MKKLIKNTCIRTAFSYNKVRKNIDGVFIGPSLGSVLKNIIIKTDTFTDIKVHFLDIKTDRNETDLFYKTTHIEQ